MTPLTATGTAGVVIVGIKAKRKCSERSEEVIGCPVYIYVD